jgi:hypothetical protein
MLFAFSQSKRADARPLNADNRRPASDSVAPAQRRGLNPTIDSGPGPTAFRA